eukprot:NODE_276_length_10970_cov_0.627909.p7 type:complete len:198 gc:universal NODE_276_length_10970_cov_0.627909:4140-4733(+)
MSNLRRIFQPDYLPDDTDIIKCRIKSIGVTETKFDLPPLHIQLFDAGGQRSERRKWIHCFETVNCVLFVAALSEYNQVLLEDPEVSRLQESLNLFDSIINSRWFSRSSIIFFMNKSDIFKEKLKVFLLKKQFPDFEYGTDSAKAGKYLLSKFVALNRQKLRIYPHFTNATDTSQIKVVFLAVKDTLLQSTLKGNGIF